MTLDEFFRKVSHDGLTDRLNFLFPVERYPRDSDEYKEIDQRYRDRLEFELNVIIQMGFPGYFLIVMDFIQWAKDNNVPVGPGEVPVRALWLPTRKRSPTLIPSATTCCLSAF